MLEIQKLISSNLGTKMHVSMTLVSGVKLSDLEVNGSYIDLEISLTISCYKSDELDHFSN